MLQSFRVLIFKMQQYHLDMESTRVFKKGLHIEGLVPDCSNSSALAMELLQSYAEPSINNSRGVSNGVTAVLR